MGIESINEPGTSRTTMVTPVSINEPPHLPTDAIAPVISGIAPETCAIGDADFTLVVTGENFFPGSLIHFAGYDEPTTLSEDGSLSTGVNMALWKGPDTVQVMVRNGNLMSNAVDFTFDPASAKASARHARQEVDPDDLDEEIAEAEEEGDLPANASIPQAKEEVMGWAVVTVASGGLPVVDVTATTARGLPVSEAANKFGVAVTKVAAGGWPVVYVSGAGTTGGGLVRSAMAGNTLVIGDVTRQSFAGNTMMNI